MERVGLGVLVSMLVVVPFAVDSSSAQTADIRVTVDDLECLPVAENGLGWAQVENRPPDSEVRLYFRRLHEEVEDYYYVPMRADSESANRYWGVFPEAEDEILERRELRDDDLLQTYRDRDPNDDQDYLWAWWWREKQASEDRDPNDGELDPELIDERADVGRKEPRHWIETISDPDLERWLESLENEPAEYFAAVYDRQGRRVARSQTKAVRVKEECDVRFTPQQDGESENLTIGETSVWQPSESVFHWLCDGIVTRVDTYAVKRADDVCRACVVAWWQRRGLILAGVVPCVGGFCTPGESPVSPFTP